MIRPGDGVSGRRADPGTKDASPARRYPDSEDETGSGLVVASAWDGIRLDVWIPTGRRSRGWPRPGRVSPVSSRLNRREVLGAYGVAGAAPAAAPPPPPP